MLALIAFPLIFLAVAASPANAADDINWKTLRPQLSPLKDPLGALTQDQRFDIQTIAWARTLSEDQKRVDYNIQAVEDAERYEREFEAAGLNVDKLLRSYAEWEAERQRRNGLINDQLDNKQVRMAGYLLPLEFSDSGNTEFLLVPYVGACVHTPPPPPNQIVFVNMAKKFRVTDLYTPVWIKGKLSAKPAKKSISFSDGDRAIDIGYRFEGATAEPYTE